MKDMKKVLFLSALTAFSLTSLYANQVLVYSRRDKPVEVEAKGGKLSLKGGEYKSIELPASGEFVFEDEETNTTYKIDKNTAQAIAKDKHALFLDYTDSQEIRAYKGKPLTAKEVKQVEEGTEPLISGKHSTVSGADNKLYLSTPDMEISLIKVK